MADSTQLTGLRQIEPEDAAAVAAFFAALPERDRMFFKEDVDLETVHRWCADRHTPRWLLVGENGDPRAYLGIVRGVGWGSHVGELRLVVGAAERGRGLGRALARRGLVESMRLGLEKVTVEVVADKQSDIDMFTAIGFEAEALLKNHVRDRQGELRDLVMLGHDIAAVADGMELVGLDGELGLRALR